MVVNEPGRKRKNNDCSNETQERCTTLHHLVLTTKTEDASNKFGNPSINGLSLSQPTRTTDYSWMDSRSPVVIFTSSLPRRVFVLGRHDIPVAAYDNRTRQDASNTLGNPARLYHFLSQHTEGCSLLECQFLQNPLLHLSRLPALFLQCPTAAFYNVNRQDASIMLSEPNTPNSIS